uniref:BRCT domain-containing protein n=1 Tax=Ciona intestinalis TaxID=7719 RepID=H2XNU4_CIOIN
MSPFNQAKLDSPFIQKIPESDILKDCVCFVDVWSRQGNDNRSSVFGRILKRMGATIARRFTKNEAITHVVFKDGHKLYLQKAKRRGIQVVSCLWVERCRVTQMRANENEFIFDESNYKPPKRFKELQPLSPEEERIRSEERRKRILRKEEKEENLRRRKIPLHPYRFIHPCLVAETPNESIQRKLQRMKEDCSDIAANTIVSSQKSSDMELTCIDKISGICPMFDINENKSTNTDNVALEKEKSSSFRYYYSTLYYRNTSHDVSSTNTPTLNLQVSSTTTNNSLNSNSNQSSHKSKPTVRRRSSRRSSVSASVAISKTFRATRIKSCATVKEIDVIRDPTQNVAITFVSSGERQSMQNNIKKLGQFSVHSSVKDERASHVVCGAARRTMNVLRAISRGLWLLTKEWVVDSLEAGAWLDEENYEAINYFPVCRQARLLRNKSIKTAASWTLSVFKELKGLVYVAPTTTPPPDELRELVTLCGGHVINSPRRASVRVGKSPLSPALPAVSESWVLDSISENCLKPTQSYLIT